MKNKYLSRIADRLLDSSLEASGAVLIEGPKWCGKTRTAVEKAASTLFMQDPDHTASYLMAADTKPSLLLQGAVPRLIDEWQIAPVLWDAVRYAVDERGSTGQFILTGSAVPRENAVRHTGTGRISRVLMRPMSLYESLESNGAVSLKTLFQGVRDIEGTSNLTIENIAFAIARGGWPASIGEKESIAVKRVYDYVDSIINIDVSRVDEVEKNPARVRVLMKSLARNVSTAAKLSTIHNDISGDEDTLSEKTIASYMNALRRIFVIEDLPAWNPAMRSRTALRTSPKRHFIDPSIATAVLRATADSLLGDFSTFGLLFESLCIRDLRIYAQTLDGEVFHYRDKSGLEADAVIHLKDGRWGAVEVKLGMQETEEACRNLITLKEKINTEKMKEPSFLMVLTGSTMAYRRQDGVFVVPAGCLKD
ncbi:MAG TPA: AAA family ATPase [Clostridiales bacterium]|nr:AAA family ATPase [Clostridiales bacterium]